MERLLYKRLLIAEIKLPEGKNYAYIRILLSRL